MKLHIQSTLLAAVALPLIAFPINVHADEPILRDLENNVNIELSTYVQSLNFD